ncbi:uncharacterized protein C8R40DRAFT_1226338 [Lentinula edodes]|uniref:uncharacterized protein n=1 Tax=Lentinula edodes TaxID=5353 RepID=UPI001E8E9AD3|nr:uncharacterized protein C8R40DRAFT_1226338 [Lentinula edodes]KAH7877655.1 hypothetical protein C8R40DRAFT_1226338 [Lentinula edodes]
MLVIWRWVVSIPEVLAHCSTETEWQELVELFTYKQTKALHYNDCYNGKLAVLRNLRKLEEYVAQNSSGQIQRKREVRMALRALEGQTVRWPYNHISEDHVFVQRQEVSYQFLLNVYGRPRSTTRLARSALEFERDLRVRQLLVGSDEIFETAYAHLCAVFTTETATWWYIFWVDLWRRYHDTISNLQLHDVDFNPYYPTSIAYTPLPRPILESFLTQCGLLSMPSKRGDFFHCGFLST